MMSAPNTPSASASASAISPTRQQRFSITRLFSFDSIQQCTTPTEIINQAQWEHKLTSKEFLLKIAQIIIAILCTGLYSEGIKIMDHSITTMMFPNVVFSAFIIITSVIAMSYVLGHVMPDVLVRIFNCLGLILYFVAATMTGHYYIVVGQYKPDEGETDEKKLELKLKADMLLAETCMAFLNTLLYGIDVFLSVKRTFQIIESPGHKP